MARPIYRNKRVFIIPAARVTAANQALEAKGFGKDNFSVELVNSTLRNGVVTHYACDVNMTNDMLSDFQAVLGIDGKEKNPRTADRLTKALEGEGIERKAEPSGR